MAVARVVYELTGDKVSAEGMVVLIACMSRVLRVYASCVGVAVETSPDA